MIEGTITLGVQKGLNDLRDDKQDLWLRAKVAVFDPDCKFRHAAPPETDVNTGRMWQTNAEMNTNLSMEPYFRVNSARPRTSSVAARGESPYFQGNAGDTYGDTLYRIFLLFPATSCKINSAIISFIINDLCISLRRYAVSCKT